MGASCLLISTRWPTVLTNQ